MRNQLFNYLTFGKSERIAIITVILIIICLLLLPALYSRYHKPVPFTDSIFDKEVADFLKTREDFEATYQGGFDFTNPDKEIRKHTIMPFEFDPNNLDQEGWQKLGFTEKQAAGIIKYRSKGGSFRKKEDLKKLYPVTDEIYRLLEPYIRINEARQSPVQQPEVERKITQTANGVKEKYRVELNSADSAELVKVYGIGPATARRIIRYREKLGGFAAVEQLQEVTGIDSARFAVIKDGVFADVEVIRKIEVNTASITQLRQHPYIDYYVAKAIVDKRIRSGAYSSPDELSGIPLIYDALFKKLRPYISITQVQ